MGAKGKPVFVGGAVLAKAVGQENRGCLGGRWMNEAA